MINQRKKYLILLIGPAVFVLLALTVFPFIYALYLSFHDYNWLYLKTRGVSFVGISNFVRLFQDPVFWGSLETTGVYVGGALVLEIVLGMSIALFLNREVKFLKRIRPIILIPMMLTPVVIACTFRLIFNYDYGLANYILELLGQSKISWLGTATTARASLIIADVWQWTPFLILIFLAALQAVPKAPLEAADVDGANSWQKFVYIVLPYIKPIVGLGVLLRLMDLMKFFDKIYVLTGGGPGVSTETLPYFIYKVSFKYFQMGYGASISIVTLIILIGISLVLVRYTRSLVARE